jgi:8-oxo-dGTP pyrophosphatase MutT (NUDIX family)
MAKEFAIYHASLKILLRKGDSFLFLTNARLGFLDLPGGRIDAAEHETPLEDILAREIVEELGGNLKYTVGTPIFQYRAAMDGANIMITVYEADYLEGALVLSREHSGARWLKPEDIDFGRENFVNGETRAAFEKYFKEKRII